MQNHFQSFLDNLEKLGLSDDQKAYLLDALEAIQKDYQRIDFLHRRTSKDKEITINILKATVAELQKQKDVAMSANEQLLHQKQLLEQQASQITKNFDALQMSYSELEMFSYIASHDLKSPLRNIGSYAQLLKKRYYNKLDADANEFLDYIVHNAQSMNDILGDLLIYSRVDADKEMSEVNLNRLLELVKHNLRQNIEENQAVINISELPTLWVHRSATIQLFQNLIENAIKYRNHTTPRIHISAKQLIEGTWQFSVKDNGVGLDTIYQQKAFQPFQRINHRDRPGSGMGLAICRKVARMHGGNIWYEPNTEGGGTIFHFTIPTT